MFQQWWSANECPKIAATFFLIVIGSHIILGPSYQKRNDGGSVNGPPHHTWRVERLPIEFSRPNITLISGHGPRSSILFILDCSQSMSQPTAINAGVKGAVKMAERLSIAKTHLVTILDELVASNKQKENIHVGVQFCGHRVGRVNGIANGSDIEFVLRLGKFDDVINAAVKKRINSVKPYGESPLYLGLKKALEDFQTEEPDSRKYVIAI